MTTPSLQRLTDDDRARLRADRRRLMYVAVTRARERLVFVGDMKLGPGRRGPDSQPRFGAIVATLASTGAIETREATTEVRSALPPRGEGPEMTLAIDPPAAREVGLTPTALQDFRHCARRFELVHLVGLPEPTPRALGRFRADGTAAPNARVEGEALHRVLERIDLGAMGGTGGAEHARHALALGPSLDAAAEERVVTGATRFLESEYARSTCKAKEIWRERAFVVTLESSELTLTLRGAMDLVVVWPSGEVDVVDYKSARGPDLRPHALQLDVYAYAAQVQLGASNVRAGAIFLGSDGAEPRFRPPITRAALEAELLDLAGRVVAARTSNRPSDVLPYARAAPKTCHAIGCGYFSLCHPAREKRQLTLFQ